MNCATYNLEFSDGNMTESIDCFHIDYFLCVENRIELKLSCAGYIPQTRPFYFRNYERLRNLESFLTVLQNEKRNIPKDHLYSYFLHREFESLIKEDGKSIPCVKVKKYLQNLNLFDDALLYRIEAMCTIKEWCALWTRIMKQQDGTGGFLHKIFMKYSTKSEEGQNMTEENFREFLRQLQKEEKENYDITNLMKRHLDKEKLYHSDSCVLLQWDYEEFIKYLCSDENAMFNPVEDTVHHDMTHQLSCYWINSSHNTYLTGSHRGSADVKSFEQAMRLGVRCIDICVRNGDKCGGKVVPIVYHGPYRPFLPKLKLDDVLKTINDHAFSTSQYPLIISIDIQCNEENKKIAAQLLKTVFGEKLMERKNSDGRCDLPSPADLMDKIILKGPRTEFQEDDEISLNLKSNNSSDERELCDLLHFCQESSGEITMSKIRNKEINHNSVLSNTNEELLKISEECENLVELIEYNRTRLSRISPSSGNFNPIPHWKVGAQLTGLNVQTSDAYTRLNTAMFRQNGNSGYVLKGCLNKVNKFNIDF